MIRRFLTRFLMVVLIAACAYNAWQVHQLQAQVAVLRGQSAAAETAARPVKSAARAGSLERATTDAAQAKAALLKGDFQGANRHLERSLAALREVTAEPQARTASAIAQVQRALASLQSHQH